ncbi:hypothetical protein B0H65DRAFT_582589, partial [Neurospora tetraspora]
LDVVDSGSKGSPTRGPDHASELDWPSGWVSGWFITKRRGGNIEELRSRLQIPLLAMLLLRLLLVLLLLPVGPDMFHNDGIHNLADVSTTKRMLFPDAVPYQEVAIMLAYFGVLIGGCYVRCLYRQASVTLLCRCWVTVGYCWYRPAVCLLLRDLFQALHFDIVHVVEL